MAALHHLFHPVAYDVRVHRAPVQGLVLRAEERLKFGDVALVCVNGLRRPILFITHVIEELVCHHSLKALAFDFVNENTE